MTTLFSYPYKNFSENSGNITISTWPVVINHSKDKVLLHLSPTTGKYQFIWWRLDDSFSPRENALIRAKEVVKNNLVVLRENDPLVLFDTIIRDDKKEEILFIHYEASIKDENDIWDAIWMSLDQIKNIQTSSPNVIIASKFFLKK